MFQSVARGNIQQISYIPGTEQYSPFGLMLLCPFNWYATVTCSTAFWDCKRYVAALQQMLPVCPTLSLPFHAPGGYSFTTYESHCSVHSACIPLSDCLALLITVTVSLPLLCCLSPSCPFSSLLLSSSSSHPPPPSSPLLPPPPPPPPSSPSFPFLSTLFCFLSPS